ncbi:MAG TPA: response regulator transcription factor [Planctomycetota bacterium]|nr:response regulator transcription factor [Planctomycetota bacterium]
MGDRVLLVEDDPKLGQKIVEILSGAGFEPTWLTDGDRALEEPLASYALLVLDLMLPGTYGLDVVTHVRRTSGVPILVVSARNETADKVRALKLGADDYVTKPFWPEELLARVQARLRRPLLQPSSVVRVGSLEIDLDARRVSAEGGPVDLTRAEFEILAELARRRGAAVTRSRLTEHALDAEEGSERTLDVHVSRIRKKLGAAGRQVVTVWGLGYRLEARP